jgi:uncharacterized repeat protein (TIGR02543 family)
VLNIGQLNPKVPVYQLDYQTQGGVNDPGNRVFFTSASPSFTLQPASQQDKVFLGWFTQPDGGDEVTAINPGDYALRRATAGGVQKIALYAHWGTWRIDYRLGGGQNDPANPTEYGQNSDMPLLPAKRPGYNFAGWFTFLADPTTRVKSVTNPGLSGDLTLYANWQKDPWMSCVSFDSAGGSAIDDICVAKGTRIQAPVPHYPGANFEGWYYLDRDKGVLRLWDFQEPILTDIKLIAKWQVQTIGTVVTENNPPIPLTEGSGADNLTGGMAIGDNTVQKNQRALGGVPKTGAAGEGQSVGLFLAGMLLVCGLGGYQLAKLIRRQAPEFGSR